MLPTDQPLTPETNIQNETKAINRRAILYGVVITVIVSIIIFVSLFIFITAPRNEKKGVFTNNEIQQQNKITKNTQVFCGNPPEELDSRHMELSSFTPFAVNEWYVDPVNPAESFIELRNTSKYPLNTSNVSVMMWPADSSAPIHSEHKGILPAADVGAGCIITIHEKDLIKTSYADNVVQKFSTTIIPTSLIVGTNKGNGGGQVNYFPNMPAGFSVSLTPAGKYVVAPKTPGQYNGAVAKSTFNPSIDAVRYFKEIVPYVSEKQPDEKVVAKWDSYKPTVIIAGDYSSKDKLCVEQAIESLRPITGLALPVVEKKANKMSEKSAINIFYVSPSKFPEWANRDNLADASPFWFGMELTNHIKEGQVYINPALSDLIKCQYAYWGIGRSLGVMRVGKAHPGSIFNESFGSKAEYSQLDKDIIRMLYDRLIESNDDLIDINHIFPD